MMEAAPASPLEMGEAEFTFEFLVVALDAPAQFGRVDENVDGRVFGQGRKPVFGRLFFALGPFDEKPFQRMGRRNLPVPRSRPNPHGREARRQDFVRALPPWNDAPSLLGKPPREASSPGSWRKQGHVRRRGACAMAGGPARSRVWAAAVRRRGARRSASTARRPHRPNRILQNGVAVNVSRHHLRQRAIVRRSTDTTWLKRSSRASLTPCCRMAISTTMVATYTLRPRKRSDGGVARERQPSTAQQKLKRWSCSGPRRHGRPRGLRA